MGTLDSIRRFGLLAHAAYVDGRLAPEERAILDRKARDLGVAEPAAAEMLDLARRRQLPFEVPPDAAERARLFDEIVDLEVADGVVQPSEESLLRRLGKTLGLGPADVHERLRAAMERHTLRRTKREPRPEDRSL
jgi:uncharacterized tellurite resistance protein B-like protein